uniref:(northern house mosquito) hypothetical protein n=1 Tax=Culex pipiens TaxID=7175 RepID=A0A8D8CCM9_CULPI
MLSIANIVRQPRLLSHSETHTVIELSLTLTNCIRSENGLSPLCLSHGCIQMVAVTTQQNAEQKKFLPSDEGGFKFRAISVCDRSLSEPCLQHSHLCVDKFGTAFNQLAKILFGG